MFRIVSPADFLHEATEGRSPTVEITSWFLDRKIPGGKYEIQVNFYGKKVSDCPPIICRDKESDPNEFYKNTFSSQTNTAIAVPYEKLGLLKVLFPQLKIRRYYYWGSSSFTTNGLATMGAVAILESSGAEQSTMV